MWAISSWSPSTSAPRSASRKDSGEDGVERATEHVLPRPAEERLHGAVPAHHAALEVEHHDAGVEALEDVLVVLLEPPELLRLLAQAAEEAPVHDRGGRLRGQRLQGVDLLAVERVEAVLPPHAEHRDHLPLHPAGEEPGEAGGGDVGALGGRGVHVHGLAQRQPGEERAPRRDPGPPLAGAGHAAGAERGEVPALVGQQERHLAQAERGPHALEEPLARPLEVEVRVQVLGEAHEGLARAVALP